MKNICTIDIDAPITKVFDFINDASKHKLWLEGLEDTIREPGYDPKNPLGSKFQQKIRDGKKVEVYDGEVTAYDRPQAPGCAGSQQGVFGPDRLSAHESEEAHAPRVRLRGHVSQPRVQDDRRSVSFDHASDSREADEDAKQLIEAET